MKKTIVISGGAGFIGSHLCKRLLDNGDSVVCLDNLYTGSEENIRELRLHKDFKFVRQDVCDFYDTQVDRIYNLACPASPIHYQKFPLFTAKTSILGAMNMLELAKKNGARILQASTSEVYGNPLVHPQKESYWGNVNPIGIRSCYDEGKRMAETLFFDYHRQYGVDTRVVRIFNTYGPNMQVNDGRVVSNFILQALQNQDITVYGDGCQTRSFCYVDDMISGLIKMMESEKNLTGPINLGNVCEITMLELAEKIIQLTGSTSRIVHEPLPLDDPIHRRPDIKQAKQLIDWQPQIDLEIGLSATIDYFRKKL